MPGAAGAAGGRRERARRAAPGGGTGAGRGVAGAGIGALAVARGWPSFRLRLRRVYRLPGRPCTGKRHGLSVRCDV